MTDEERSVRETEFFMSIPCMRDEITAGLKTPVGDCVPESEVDWDEETKSE